MGPFLRDILPPAGQHVTRVAETSSAGGGILNAELPHPETEGRGVQLRDLLHVGLTWHHERLSVTLLVALGRVTPASHMVIPRKIVIT